MHAQNIQFGCFFFFFLTSDQNEPMSVQGNKTDCILFGIVWFSFAQLLNDETRKSIWK